MHHTIRLPTGGVCLQAMLRTRAFIRFFLLLLPVPAVVFVVAGLIQPALFLKLAGRFPECGS
jgi:hypothetical protein